MTNTPIKIEFSPDGYKVFASVAGANPGGIPIVPEQVLMALEGAGAQDFDVDYMAIDRLLKMQSDFGKPIAIATKIDARVQVTIRGDKMEASVFVTPPKGGRDVEVGDIIGALATEGVCAGIKEDAINNLVYTQWYNERVSVAEGIPPVDGTDAKIEFLFEIEENGPKPAISDEGVVDFYELGMIENVRADQPLASKIPADPGLPGKNVLGEEIPAKSGRDIPFPIGKGVTFSKDDSNMLVAQIAGQPRLMSGRIHVLPIYEVKGDVDFSTGNITFVGDVLVKGSVTEGFVIKAEGNITIMGPVGGCMLEAGGTVFLNKGMHGQDKGIIIAGEDVVAKFLEHTTVKSNGSVKATDGIIQCNCTAKKNIVVEGKKGLIIGGRVSAGEEIRAKIIGNHLATPTDVEAGGSPKVREELRQIEEQKKQFKLNLDRTEKGVNSLKMLQEKMGSLPQAKKDLLLQLTRAQYHLIGQMKKLEAREEELEEILSASYKGKVIVSDSVFPGTRIIIKQAVLHIRDVVRATTFYEQEGEIQIGAYTP